MLIPDFAVNANTAGIRVDIHRVLVFFLCLCSSALIGVQLLPNIYANRRMGGQEQCQVLRDSFVFDLFVCVSHGFYVFAHNRRKEFAIVCGVITLLMMVTGLVLFSLIVVDLRVCVFYLLYSYCTNVTVFNYVIW